MLEVCCIPRDRPLQRLYFTRIKRLKVRASRDGKGDSLFQSGLEKARGEFSKDLFYLKRYSMQRISRSLSSAILAPVFTALVYPVSGLDSIHSLVWYSRRLDAKSKARVYRPNEAEYIAVAQWTPFCQTSVLTALA